MRSIIAEDAQSALPIPPLGTHPRLDRVAAATLEQLSAALIFPRQDPAGAPSGAWRGLDLCLQVLGEAPGHHGGVAWVVDVLLADPSCRRRRNAARRGPVR